MFSFLLGLRHDTMPPVNRKCVFYMSIFQGKQIICCACLGVCLSHLLYSLENNKLSQTARVVGQVSLKIPRHKSTRRFSNGLRCMDTRQLTTVVYGGELFKGLFFFWFAASWVWNLRSGCWHCCCSSCGVLSFLSGATAETGQFVSATLLQVCFGRVLKEAVTSWLCFERVAISILNCSALPGADRMPGFRLQMCRYFRLAVLKTKTGNYGIEASSVSYMSGAVCSCLASYVQCTFAETCRHRDIAIVVGFDCALVLEFLGCWSTVSLQCVP